MLTKSIVITNKGCSQSYLLNPAMITTAVRNALRVHAENKSTAEPDKCIYSLHCKCVSDLSKYCVYLLGKERLGPVRGGFPISNYTEL